MRIMRLVNVGVGVAAASAAVMAAAPSASAGTGDPVHGWGGMSFANQTNPVANLTSCSNEFHGRLTEDHDGGAGTTARVDDFSFLCEPGTSVTARALPWTLSFTTNGVVLSGVDVDVTTPEGTCHYTGDLTNGAFQFPGVYSIAGALHRRSGDCGGTEVLGVAAFTEAIAGL